MIVTSKITNLDEISDFITLFIFREVALNLKNTELRKIFYVYIHWYKHPNRMFFDQFSFKYWKDRTQQKCLNF